MNPKILPVLDEITAVLKKHDMMGLVIVGNQTHCDWRMEVAASWSCARVEAEDEKGFAIRIRAKRVDYPTLEAHKQCVEATVGTFVTFGHIMLRMNEQIERMLLAISKQVDFLGKSIDEN